MAENSVEYAIDLIKSGKKEEGRNLLIELIIHDPYNEEAWLWMSSASSGAERIDCLQKALEINPQNEHAQTMLNKLTAGDSEEDGSKKLASAEIKENQVEEEMVFSPDMGIVFLVHILPGIIFLAYAAIWAVTLEGWLTTQTIIVMVSASIILCVLLMLRKMSVFKVRLTPNGLEGPLFFIQVWLKHEIPIRDIDLKKTGTALGFLGYYRIHSYEGASVYLIGYSEETLIQIASLIRYYQAQ